MDVQQEPDGGATLRCSQQELVRFYNGLSEFMSAATPAEDEAFPQVMRELRLQLHQLAVLVGMEKHHPHPDG